MDLLADYAFVDCLLLGFRANADLRALDVEVEACFPSTMGSREKKPLSVHMTECREVLFKANPEFWRDLDRPYRNGDTMKANEVTRFSVTREAADRYRAALESDMLTLELVCRSAMLA